MNTNPITTATLASSVLAVPPLARNSDLSFSPSENEKLIRHIEAGGVTTLLYGGNAVLYHVSVSEYAELLGFLAGAVADQTLVIPSVGPAFGTMMDQVAILRDTSFPTAMILPTGDVATSDGIASAVRRFVEALGRPAALYVKNDGYIQIDAVKRLMDDNLLSFIKYAIERDDTANDPWLSELVDTVGPSKIVSGMGEQPAITHLQEFGLAGFTSGCVCVAPRLSMEMLAAVKSGELESAERIRGTFAPLEDLRNSIHAIRVLHAAIGLAGIGDMGPILPPLSEVGEADRPEIQAAAEALLRADCAAVSNP